ncbi:MAG: VWA domain-containing protein [Pelolinea sp.]|nr:VWA domain-containing protein [Pelolinea sp.]
MGFLMRCLYCGLLQDEPAGVKACARCGGELVFEADRLKGQPESYISAQMELDQVYAPSGKMIDRFILFSIRSPKEVPDKFKTKRHKQRPAVNFNPVLDRSGSMHGIKLDYSKEAIRHSLNYLKEGDVFSLTMYDNEITSLFEPRIIFQEFLEEVEKALPAIHAGGSTALHAGLETGIQHAGKLTRDANLVLLLSDGLANQGVTDLEVIGLSAKEARNRGITVSTIGVGLDYNEALMSVVALQGGGRFYHIEDPHQIPAFIAGELGEAANWAGKALEIHLKLPMGASAMALSEVYPLTQTGDEVKVTIGNLPCDTSLEIPVRVSFPSQKTGAKLQIEGDLSFAAPSDTQITTSLNPVTLRIMERSAFLPNSGVVEEVLYRVLQQRKYASLMNINHAMNIRGRDAVKEEKNTVEELREYALHLGEERAEYELHELNMRISDIHGPSNLSKTSVYNSYQNMRGQKDFLKRKGR